MNNKSFLPYGSHQITEEDINEVVKVLRSSHLTQGLKVPEFESELAKKVSARFSIAVNSATSALHIACLSLGLEKGDYVWTSPITFVASANCALYCGAKVDFVDIDQHTGLISVQKLQDKLIRAERDGKLPKILIPVHLTGTSCEMEEIKKLSNKYGFKIIEDASHAIGGIYNGSPVGSCKYSDITVFSFHPVKIITTAEGGAAMTNSDELAHKMRNYRTHGIEKKEDFLQKKNVGPWYYEQQTIGFNYRLTDLQASLGISQINRLDNIIKTRNNLLNNYLEILKELPLSFLEIPNKTISSVHLAVILISNEFVNSYKEIFNGLRKQNIGVQLHYLPVHLHPFYQKMGFSLGDFPSAEKYSRSAISLPLFPGLNIKDQYRVYESLRLCFESVKIK